MEAVHNLADTLIFKLIMIIVISDVQQNIQLGRNGIIQNTYICK